MTSACPGLMWSSQHRTCSNTYASPACRRTSYAARTRTPTHPDRSSRPRRRRHRDGFRPPRRLRDLQYRNPRACPSARTSHSAHRPPRPRRACAWMPDRQPPVDGNGRTRLRRRRIPRSRPLPRIRPAATLERAVTASLSRLQTRGFVSPPFAAALARCREEPRRVLTEVLGLVHPWSRLRAEAASPGGITASASQCVRMWWNGGAIVSADRSRPEAGVRIAADRHKDPLGWRAFGVDEESQSASALL